MPHVFDDYERDLEAKARADMAALDAKWAALPQAERDRIIAASQKRLADAADALVAAELADLEYDGDEDPDDDDDDDD